MTGDWADVARLAKARRSGSLDGAAPVSYRYLCDRPVTPTPKWARHGSSAATLEFKIWSEGGDTI